MDLCDGWCLAVVPLACPGGCGGRESVVQRASLELFCTLAFCFASLLKRTQTAVKRKHAQQRLVARLRPSTGVALEAAVPQQHKNTASPKAMPWSTAASAASAARRRTEASRPSNGRSRRARTRRPTGPLTGSSRHLLVEAAVTIQGLRSSPPAAGAPFRGVVPNDLHAFHISGCGSCWRVFNSEDKSG